MSAEHYVEEDRASSLHFPSAGAAASVVVPASLGIVSESALANVHEAMIQPSLKRQRTFLVRPPFFRSPRRVPPLTDET